MTTTTKPAATVEVAYDVTPRNFWPACRDGARTYVESIAGIQSARPDNARRVLVLDGTKAGTRKAADALTRLWPEAVAALRQRDAQDRSAIREQRKTAEGRATRWDNEQRFLSAYVASGGAL